MKSCLLLAALLLSLSIGSVEAGVFKRSSPATVRSTDASPFYPWSDDEDPPMMLSEKLWSASKAAAVTAYGTNLLVFSQMNPGQVHIMTMMRATGFDKIEKMVLKIRENVRAAIWKVIWNSPTFWRVKHNYRSFRNRAAGIRNIIKESRKARADGVVTAQEAAKIKKLRKKEIEEYQKEMARLRKAGNSLKKVWEALDIDEIQDVVKGFLFQMMAVLASGHNDSFVGKLISKWCLFLNLGSLFLDLNTKLHFPISRLLVTKGFSSAGLTPDKVKSIEKLGQVLMFGAAGYMTIYRTVRARQLNASLMSSAIIFKGLRNFVESFLDREDVVGDSIWSSGGGFLEGASGGLFMLSLTSFGLGCREKAEVGQLTAPQYVLKPFQTIEKTIDRMVLVLDKVV